MPPGGVVPPQGYFLNGVKMTQAQIYQVGTLNGTGGASLTLGQTNLITPANTTWGYTVCPQATAACFNQSQTAIGASQTVTLTPPAIQIPAGSANSMPLVYATTEVTTAQLGSQVFVIGTGAYICTITSGPNCGTWTASSGGGGGGGGNWPSGVQFVAPTGNDVNNGNNWTTAKATIFAALEALPGGSASPPTRGNGLVYVTQGAHANPTANAGIWIMSSSDPNYASPPAGWLREGSGSVAIIGDGCQDLISNHSGGYTCQIVGGSSADVNHPALWISGATGMLFQNLTLTAGLPAALSLDSNGARNTTGLVNKRFENVVFEAPNISGLGPNVTIGGNSFNNYFDHIGGDSVAANVRNISTVSRTSNITTVNTTAAHNLSTGAHCGLLGVTDTTYNGSYYSITVTGGSSFTVPNTGANGSSSGGTVVCDQTMFMVMDGGGAAIGIGLTFITNSEFNNAGIRFWANASSNESFNVASTYTENGVSPAIWTVTDSVTGIIIRDVASADSSVGSVRNDGVYPVWVENSCPCVGPYVSSNAGNTLTTIPLLNNQSGIINGYLRANTNIAASSPQAVRYANTITLAPASWFFKGGQGTVTGGQADRDGGSNAATANDTGIADAVVLYNAAPTENPGDWIIGGVWAKQSVAAPIANPLVITQTALICANAPGTQGPYDGEAGSWEWFTIACKIRTIGSGGNLFLQYSIGAGASAGLYEPVLFKIPTGTLTDAEVMEVQQNLRGYSGACAVSNVCDVTGPFPHVIGATTNLHVPIFNSNGDLVDSGSTNGASVGTFGASYSSGYTFTNQAVSTPFTGNLMVATVSNPGCNSTYSAGSGWSFISAASWACIGVEWQNAGSATSYSGAMNYGTSQQWGGTITTFTNSGTPALVQASVTHGGATTCTYGTVSANHLLYVAFFTGGIALTSVTDTIGTTYKLAGLRLVEASNAGVGDGDFVEIWYGISPSGGANTATVHTQSGSVSCAEFSGVATSGTILVDYNFQPDGLGATSTTTPSGATTNPQFNYNAVNNTTGNIDYGGATNIGGVYGRDHGAVFRAASAALASTGGTLYHKKGLYYGQTAVNETNNGQTNTWYVFGLPPSPSGGVTQVYWNLIGENSTQSSYGVNQQGTIFVALPSTYSNVEPNSSAKLSVVYQRPWTSGLNNSVITRDSGCRMADNQRAISMVCFDDSQTQYSEHENALVDTYLGGGGPVAAGCPGYTLPTNSNQIGFLTNQSGTNETYFRNTWANGLYTPYLVNSNHFVMINSHAYCNQNAGIFNITISGYGGTTIHYQDINNATGIQYNCPNPTTHFEMIDEIIQYNAVGGFARSSQNSESAPGACNGRISIYTGSSFGAALTPPAYFNSGSGANFRVSEADRTLLPGLVTSNFTSQATTGTTKQTLATYTFPYQNSTQGTQLGVFQNNPGAVFDIEAWATAANNANSKVFEIDLGGTAVATITSVTTGGVSINCHVKLIVSSTANVQEIVGECNDGTTRNVLRTAPGLTGSATVIMNVAGTTAGAIGDLTFRGLTVEYVGGN
jgi:hypothetical protein